jgi:hypothetical protein
MSVLIIVVLAFSAILFIFALMNFFKKSSNRPAQPSRGYRPSDSVPQEIPINSNADLAQQQRRDAAQTGSVDKTAHFHVSEAAPGDSIEISGITGLANPHHMIVSRKNKYVDSDSTWHELECSSSGKQYYLTIERDDGQIYLSLSLKTLSLADIKINERDLERIDDKEEGSIKYAGRVYYYEDSDEAEFFPDSQRKDSEDLYYWEFESDDGRHFISVEKWEDNSIDVTYSVIVEPSQVTIYH